MVFALVAAAAAWRLWLGAHYYGWEESDYGNLAMARGVLDSGFRHFDMNHLPMYYGLSALVLAVVGDAVVATHAVSLVGGLLTVALVALVADRVFGRTVAWTAGALAVVQPELALYSASSLREPIYAAAVMAALLALLSERPARASLAAGVAFLTRMDAALALAPALVAHALGRRPRVVRLALAGAPLAGLMLAWSAYCHEVHGTWAFWGHSVSVNVETGGSERQLGWVWALEGAWVALALLADVLPSRVGWGIWVGLWVSLVALPWGRHGGPRTLALVALGLLGFWLGVAFIAQHEPGHNLYWKWLHGVLPPLIILGADGAWRLTRAVGARFGRTAGLAAMALISAQAGWAMLAETHRQVELSEQLYKPQLDLARMLEDGAASGEAMLVDNIPACWINRRPHTLTLHSWFDVPVPPGDVDAFGAWVVRERLTWVLWFQEDWTQAPVVAPWLSDGRRHELGPIALVPVDAEPGYGWILYRVEGVDERE